MISCKTYACWSFYCFGPIIVSNNWIYSIAHDYYYCDFICPSQESRRVIALNVKQCCFISSFLMSYMFTFSFIAGIHFETISNIFCSGNVISNLFDTHFCRFTVMLLLACSFLQGSCPYWPGNISKALEKALRWRNLWRKNV